ncbi:MAG: hypothetical protein GC129_07085 [Proteobacteria bacterium]|nr:hypothetical protein [Pseudomonadota bacterium]
MFLPKVYAASPPPNLQRVGTLVEFIICKGTEVLRLLDVTTQAFREFAKDATGIDELYDFRYELQPYRNELDILKVSACVVQAQK